MAQRDTFDIRVRAARDHEIRSIQESECSVSLSQFLRDPEKAEKDLKLAIEIKYSLSF